MESRESALRIFDVCFSPRAEPRPAPLLRSLRQPPRLVPPPPPARAAVAVVRPRVIAPVQLVRGVDAALPRRRPRDAPRGDVVGDVHRASSSVVVEQLSNIVRRARGADAGAHAEPAPLAFPRVLHRGRGRRVMRVVDGAEDNLPSVDVGDAFARAGSNGAVRSPGLDLLGEQRARARVVALPVPSSQCADHVAPRGDGGSSLDASAPLRVRRRVFHRQLRGRGVERLFLRHRSAPFHGGAVRVPSLPRQQRRDDVIRLDEREPHADVRALGVDDANVLADRVGVAGADAALQRNVRLPQHALGGVDGPAVSSRPRLERDGALAPAAAIAVAVAFGGVEREHVAGHVAQVVGVELC